MVHGLVSRRRLGRMLAVLAGAIAVQGAVVLAAGVAGGAWAAQGGLPAVRAAGSWGKAFDVPGLRALDKGGNAQVLSVSCPSTGSCAAAGLYSVPHGEAQGFVVTERHGHWGTAIKVNGMLSSVSCASARNCAVGGTYTDNSGRHMFVRSERHGRWGADVVVPAPHPGTGGTIVSLSCGSPGNCAIGGNYPGPNHQYYGFVAAERNGHWNTAIREPRPGTLGLNGADRVYSVACAPHGPCTAGGEYPASYGRHSQGFLVTQAGKARHDPR